MLSGFSGLDLDRLRYAFGGALGAVVYGVYTFVQVIKAGHRPTLTDLGLAFANVGAAMVVAVIGSWALGPSLVGLIPFAALRAASDPVAVGFVVGGIGWEVLPLLIEGAKRLAGRLGTRGAGR